MIFAVAACSSERGGESVDIDGSAAPSMPCTNVLGETPHVRLCAVTRAPNNPMISPATHTGISQNITMPSVIRAPDALARAAGLQPYWMYFAAHDGHYIRLAHAPAPTGPWALHVPGSLKDTEVAPFSNTISSP